MSRTWTNEKPFKVTLKHTKSKWGLCGDRLSCRICGHIFSVGETARWVYMNGESPSPGNFHVCVKCDTSEIKEEVRDVLRRGLHNLDPFALGLRIMRLESKLSGKGA